MHRALYGAVHDRNWEEYYRDVKKRLIPDSGSSYGYHFSDEDFYVYIDAEKILSYDTILFHGSVIAVDGFGYLFTAYEKCRVGKSKMKKYSGSKYIRSKKCSNN